MSASSIYFNGRLTWRPGSYSEVDASALARPGLGAAGIVAIIGEVEGGAPYTVSGDDGIHRISSPGKVARTFRAGDLLEAGNVVFDPSKDPDIPGGAQEVIFFKVNPAVQSSLTVVDDNALNNIDFTTLDYGAFTTQIAVEIEDGTNGGKMVTVYADYLGESEEFDDLGADGWFSLAMPATIYTPISSDLSFISTLTPASSFAADWDLTTMATSAITDKAVTGSFPGYLASWTNVYVPSTQLDVASDNAADTTQVVTIYGIDNATSQPATENVTVTGTAAATSSKVWAEVYGFVLDAVTVGAVTVSHSGGTALVTLAATAGATFAGLEASADGQLEVNSGALSLVADAATTDKVLVVGYASGVTTIEEVTLTGTTAVSTTTTAWEWIAYVFTGPMADTRTITMSGHIWEDDTTAELSSDSATDTMAIIIVGYNGSGTLASETVTLNGTSTVTTANQYDMLIGAIVADPGALPTGTVTIKSSGAVLLLGGVAGDVTLGTLTASSVTAGPGFAVLMDLDDDGILTYNLSSLTGSNLVIVGFSDVGAAKVAELTLGTTGTSASWSHIAAVFLKEGDSGGSIDQLKFAPFDMDTTSYANLSAVSDYFDGFTGLSFSMLSGTPTATSLEDADIVTSQDMTVTTPTFYGIHYDVIAGVTAQSAWVSAAASTGSDQLPPADRAKSFLSGGSEGTTAFANWQAALDKAKGYRINTVIPLTDNAAVHAATISHCVFMCGPGRSERDCILGVPSATTLTDAKALVIAMNTRHARACIQDVERYNTAGAKETFPPYFTATLAGGMQSGSPVGTALTWKYINVLATTGKDSSYIVNDDADELIRAGLMMIERVPNIGYRWLRNITTYLIDSNPAYTEAGVNEAVNYAVFEFRTALEAVVGKKAFAGTVAAAEGIATSILGQLAGPGVLAISQFRNLSISIDGDVMEVDVEIAPIQSVNFVKSTLHLVSASFASAA